VSRAAAMSRLLLILAKFVALRLVLRMGLSGV
jgi:hypothetical protein